MLTRDLLRFKSAGIYLKPDFIDNTNPRLLEYAARILAFYTEGTGSSREELSGQCNPEVNRFNDLKLSRGLLKIIDDRAEYTSFQDADYPGLRHGLFTRTANLLRSGALPRIPEDVKCRVFDDAGNSPEGTALAHGIYVDLPENETLTGIKKTFPKEVLDRYNLALVQSLLLYSGSLSAEVSDDEPAKLRRMLTYLKFFRLLVRLELKKGDGERTLKLKIDGPASILENSSKYGLQLACFFPALCRMTHWKIACAVKFRPGGPEKRLSLDSESVTLHSEHLRLNAYIPAEIGMFADYFKQQNTGWELVRNPPFLRLDGQKIAFPDFQFAAPEGGRAYAMELFHRWHAAPLAERLDFCETQPTEPPLLLGVDKSLLKKDGILKARLEQSPYFQKYGFLFREFPGAEKVCALLNSQVKPQNTSKRGRRKSVSA